ncbi:response regulator [Sporolituus thermophilus]|uniref:Pilus assembly protein CpaE n=1 Tax=Sporolituus thermophilus DSM 23256 TaxID=1123285 RepID=A0A1G7HP22_9FIRM|nr:response regulator [Sporolituus thermophilus]SDF02014.1 pilus assembly protein CpaE [Sporolituus thermophilus DSM 23256]
MAEKIRVLIADDSAATRENIRKLMEFHPEITVAGLAADAAEAIAKARELRPDIILMDINMPGMDGIAATEIITTEALPASIIIMSVQGEQEYLRRAMIAGAKDYLIKPFTGDELVQAVKRVYNNEQRRRSVLKFEPKPVEPGKIITVFSTKGGIGKTTIATNLAVALAARTGAKVGIVDADLQFGDVALFLNILPQATIADLVRDGDEPDAKVLDSYLASYSEQVKVLAAPLRPEQAETVTAGHLAAILKTMKTCFKYIIVDTAPSFSDAMLAVLDASDLVLVVSAMDLPTVKNVKLCLEIMESLGYTDDKFKLVLNRANAECGMDVREVEESLRHAFVATLPSDGKTVVASVNRGVPFVVSHPEAAVSQSIFHLARTIASGDWKAEPEPRGVVHKIKRLFG